MPSPEDVLEIRPLTRPVKAEVRVPGSKSYTNRALLLAALAHGRSALTGALFSDDTRHMAEALRVLGLEVKEDEPGCRFEVTGGEGRVPATEADLFVGNAGTAARFLVAFCALGAGPYRLDGVPRMRERPMAPLLATVNTLGGSARSLAGSGSFPIVVENGPMHGGAAVMSGKESSQFFSALLMAGAVTEKGVRLEVEGQLVSRPYIDLTADVMAAFGVEMAHQDYKVLVTGGNQRYLGREYPVPPDASSASYFFAAAALTGGTVRVSGFAGESCQGDLQLLDILERMGCGVERAGDYIQVQGPEQLAALDLDMNDCSDMAQTVAALTPFAAGPTTIRNIGHTRLQESDRLSATANELRRLGQEVEEWPDGLRIHPAPVRPAVVETYDDHRMAMAFALVGLRADGVRISNPACVSKTFPDYFERLEGLRGGTDGQG